MPFGGGKQNGEQDYAWLTLYATEDATVEDLRKTEPDFNLMIKDDEELPQMD